ncbi:hypothetical protein T310_8752, partial [Rasamsonia emersonii CBS 393.64]
RRIQVLWRRARISLHGLVSGSIGRELLKGQDRCGQRAPGNGVHCGATAPSTSGLCACESLHHRSHSDNAEADDARPCSVQKRIAPFAHEGREGITMLSSKIAHTKYGVLRY